MEATSQLYRCVTPIQPWLYYLYETYQGPEKIIGILFSMTYIFSKGNHLLSRLKLFRTAVWKLFQNVVCLILRSIIVSEKLACYRSVSNITMSFRRTWEYHRQRNRWLHPAVYVLSATRNIPRRLGSIVNIYSVKCVFQHGWIENGRVRCVARLSQMIRFIGMAIQRISSSCINSSLGISPFVQSFYFHVKNVKFSINKRFCSLSMIDGSLYILTKFKCWVKST